MEIDPWGRIIYANARALEMFASREEELLGVEIFTCLDPEAATVLRGIIADPAVKAVNIAEPLYLIDRQVELSRYPLADGERRSFIFLLHDITAAKAVESAFRRTSNNLRQSLAELKSAQDVITAIDRPQMEEMLEHSGAHAVLRKPLELEELRETIGSLLAGSR